MKSTPKARTIREKKFLLAMQEQAWPLKVKWCAVSVKARPGKDLAWLQQKLLCCCSVGHG